MRRPSAIVTLVYCFLSIGAYAQNTPVTVGGLVTNALSNPSQKPSVQFVCSGTGGTYTYVYVAIDATGGTTGPSAANNAVSGCATPSPSNPNLVYVPVVPGASSCVVYRTGTSPELVGTVSCGGAILDTNSGAPGVAAPSGNSTGGVLAPGTISGQNFLATGGGAGTSDWVQGLPLLMCTQGSGTNYTQPQPCIQSGSFFVQANPSIANSFGWTAPSATNNNAGPLIVGAQSTNTGYPPTSALSVGLLTNTTVNPATSQPQLATVTGTLTGGDLVSINNPSLGLYDLIDSGIQLSSGKISTSSLTGVLSPSNGGTGTGSNFTAHSYLGNNTGSSASPSPSQIGTSDTSVNWYNTGAGTANAQTITLTPAATALTAGLEVHWRPSNANTSAATLAVNGLTAKSITKCGTSPLTANDLTTAATAIAIYDGTEFQLQNPQAQACGTVAPLCAGALVNIAAGTIVYAAFGTTNATETAAPMPVPISGTAVSLHAWANANLPYSVAVTARYNGGDLTNLTCSLSASSGATSCDNMNPGTSTIAEGGTNRWDIKLAAGGTTGGAQIAYTACIKVVNAY